MSALPRDTLQASGTWLAGTFSAFATSVLGRHQDAEFCNAKARIHDASGMIASGAPIGRNVFFNITTRKLLRH
jgi:hypothetical protein